MFANLSVYEEKSRVGMILKIYIDGNKHEPHGRLGEDKQCSGGMQPPRSRVAMDLEVVLFFFGNTLRCSREQADSAGIRFSCMILPRYRYLSDMRRRAMTRWIDGEVKRGFEMLACGWRSREHHQPSILPSFWAREQGKMG